jgi:hypothetical protein
MKRLHLLIFLCIGAGLFTSSAFALDQVKLSDGQAVQGQIVNETDSFVDIRLNNHLAKRIPKSSVASIERDISTKDPNEPPGPPRLFVSLSAGGLLLTGHTDADRVLFDYGGRVGLIAGQIGNFKLAIDLNYDRASITTTIADGVYHASGFSDYNLQLLLAPLSMSGFYFGPNAGVLFRSDTIDDVDTGSGGKNFELGGSLGYAIPINDLFSIGPDLRYDHDFGPTYLNLLKFTVVATVRF